MFWQNAEFRLNYYTGPFELLQSVVECKIDLSLVGINYLYFKNILRKTIEGYLDSL